MSGSSRTRALFPVAGRALQCYGCAEQYAGILAAALGRSDEAEARLRRAVAENDRAGAAPRAAQSLVALGGVLVEGGRHDEGRDALGLALRRAEELRLPALAAEAAAALGAIQG